MIGFSIEMTKFNELFKFGGYNVYGIYSIDVYRGAYGLNLIDCKKG